MKSQFNLIKRFLAETPPFWKRIGLVGVIIASIFGSLSLTKVFPIEISLICEGVGITLIAVSSFAVKDIDLIVESEDAAEAIQKLAKVLPDQVEAITKIIEPILNRSEMHVIKEDPELPKQSNNE